jgi:hypothetical protein
VGGNRQMFQSCPLLRLPLVLVVMWSVVLVFVIIYVLYPSPAMCPEGII